MLGQANNRETAYHEAGHALANHFLRASLPLVEVTLRPSAVFQAWGVRAHCQYRRIADPLNKVEHLKARAVVCMASFPAVQIAFGPALQAKGVSMDLQQGLQFLRDAHRDLSDENVVRLLAMARWRADNIVFKHQEKLHVLAAALLKRKTLSGAQVEEILGPRTEAILEPAF